VVPFNSYAWKIASRCNLNCSYCYVYNRGDSRWRLQPHFMSEEVATQTAVRIREHCRAHNQEDVGIIFHGGEPLLGGVDHLDKLTHIITREINECGLNVSISMQSNGLLLDSAIGDFLLSRGVSVGVSVDGPAAANDVYRVDHSNRPTSARLEAALKVLTESIYRPIFGGFLCVINPRTNPEEVIDYFLSYDPPGIDLLLPLDNHDRKPVGKEENWLLTPYGDWLISAFDRWVQSGTHTRIRLFNSIIRLLCSDHSLVETVGLDPIGYVMIETNGDIEALDALKSSFNGASRLGNNVFEHDFDTVARNQAIQTRQHGLAALCQTCQECPVVRFCGSGYLPHRYSAAKGFDNPSVYCADLEKLIRHIHAALKKELNDFRINTVP
jgi:uncharacterized protein